MSESPFVPLGSLALEITVGHVGPMASQYQSAGVPFLRSQNVAPLRIDTGGMRYIPVEFHRRLAKSSLRAGDVVVVRTGRPGTAALVPPEFDGANCSDLVIIRPGPNLDGRFLAYYLNTAVTRGVMNGRTVGSVQSHFNIGDARSLPVRIPSLAVQRSIAGLLTALDEKIELSRQTSETIERLVRALFGYWFGTLDPETVREGWSVGRLGDHIEPTRGLSYSGAGLADDGIPLHNLDSIYEGGGYKYEGIKHYRGEYKERHIVRGGDLLLANTEQGFEYLLIGFPALVPQRFGDLSLFSHHLYRVRPQGGSWLTGRFLYLALMSPRLRQVIVGYSNGTTVNMLPVDALQRPRLAVPPADLVHRFDDTVQPLLAKQEQLQLESEILAKLRDLLLSKLMSGEIRLKEAENAVAEAG